MTPTSSLATLRPDLASFEEFDLMSDAGGFVARSVLPPINSAVQSGTFGKIPLEQLLQMPETRRAPRSGYSRTDWKFETDTFATEEHGVEQPVDDREAKIYGSYFNAEVMARNRCLRIILERLERDVADAVFNTTTWTGSSLATSIGTPWTTSASATPIADINAARLKVYENSGLWPNSLVISRVLFLALRECAQIVDRLKYEQIDVTSSGITSRELARVFALDNVIVAGGTKNTAKEGQTATPAGIWNKEMAMVARIATTDDMSEPCIGRLINWEGDGGVDGLVETYRDETVRSEIVRARNDRAIKILYPQAGHLLTDAYTA
jgi:hypothetical protein